MSNDEKELEKLKAKRLEEMQKNLSENKKIEEQDSIKTETFTPRETILKRLGHRGLEVIEAAESQYPNETIVIISKLSELILSGDINEELDGGKLLTLFRAVGLNIRLNTKINIEQDGKYVSLSEKFSKKDADISN